MKISLVCRKEQPPPPSSRPRQASWELRAAPTLLKSETQVEQPRLWYSKDDVTSNNGVPFVITRRAADVTDITAGGIVRRGWEVSCVQDILLLCYTRSRGGLADLCGPGQVLMILGFRNRKSNVFTSLFTL